MSIGREKLLNKFTEEYSHLNEQQRKAVDQVEGPVMVVAGPGTGKTQILSARIGKILLSEAQIDPSNILCLTYTEAGVVAMRRRLSEFIGPDAYRVGIYTFHAFCNDIIQDNLSLFDKKSLDPISDLERIELLKELIDGFEKSHPLKRYRGDVYFEISSLQSLFSLMKNEGWTTDYVCTRIDIYIDDLKNRDEYVCKRATKEYKKGDIRWDKIEEQREKMEKLRAACKEFGKFQQLMRKRNCYDFDDMINWVIEAFTTNENLLRTYQEQFQYVLVDEYQDTSGSQNKIVELLINYWEKPNVFVVGDDDQSIYRFQGANIENMMSFANGYKKDLLTIVLVNNYRSVQPILDISKTLIDRNEERLIKQMEGLTKNLKASHKEISLLNHCPHIQAYETVREEMIHLTLQVEKLVLQGFPPNSIGIIYRENKYGGELANYLRLKKIPYYNRRSINIITEPLIQQILIVLDYLCAEHHIPYSGDESLFEILHFEWLRIPSIEIAKAAIKVSEVRFKGPPTSLRQWLSEQSAKMPADLFDPGMDKNLKQASLLIESLIGSVTNYTLVGLLEKIVRELGFLSYIMDHKERSWLIHLLTGFYDHVKEETRRNPLVSLQELMNRMDLMRKEGLVLPLVQVAGNDKGVNLMTVHGSKGLEFDHVFFAGCVSSAWEKKRKPFNGFSFPDTLFTTQSSANDLEELRRLFYVGITRAKRHLSFSFAHYTNEGKPLEPSVFISEIQEVHDLPNERIYVDKEVLAEFILLQFSNLSSPEVQHLEEEVIDKIVHGFVMNVSALNNYLKCPLGFFYQNIIRIPSPKNEAAEFGSAIHYALEQLFRKMKVSESFPSAQDLVKDFEWYMARHQDSFTGEQHARRLEYGRDILTQYYGIYQDKWNTIVAVELNLKNLWLDTIPLKGKIDKIEFSGKDALIVDYKTGDPERCAEKLSRPNSRNLQGGDYWRQAIFYQIMLELYPKNWNLTGVEFDFIEPDKRKQYRKERISVSSVDKDLVKEQIRSTWTKIQEKDFYTGCGKPECHWCNFVKSNKMAIALHELKDEHEEQSSAGFKEGVVV
ncbi:MAG: ATP-dependent DNA helicase [Flavisolibacter sp.]